MNELLKAEKENHRTFMPQTIDGNWKIKMKGCPQNQHHLHIGSLGNLLLLSMSINSSLQNHSFKNKKEGKIDRFGKKIRHGYSDGSHSEIKVAKYKSWGRQKIKLRYGLLTLWERMDFQFKNNKRTNFYYIEME